MSLPFEVVKEAMTSVSDAEILDIVRKLRTCIVTLDNLNILYDGLPNLNDQYIVNNVKELIPNIVDISKKVSETLKLVEGSRQYKDMVKNFTTKGNSSLKEGLAHGRD